MTTLPEHLVKGVYDNLCRINGEWQPIGPNDIKEVLTADLPFLSAQVAVKVKPLDWTEDSAPGYRLFSVQSDIGHFAYGTDADGNPWSSSPLGIKDHANEEAAKRAAEKAHYGLVVDQAKAIGLEVSALEPSAARALALEEVARWHESEAEGYEAEIGGTDVTGLLLAKEHRISAIAIRALSSPDHAEALEAKLAAAEKALEFYAEHVSGCRKIGADGDKFRASLDSDGGATARAVLGEKP